MLYGFRPAPWLSSYSWEFLWVVIKTKEELSVPGCLSCCHGEKTEPHVVTCWLFFRPFISLYLKATGLQPPGHRDQHVTRLGQLQFIVTLTTWLAQWVAHATPQSQSQTFSGITLLMLVLLVTKLGLPVASYCEVTETCLLGKKEADQREAERGSFKRRAGQRVLALFSPWFQTLVLWVTPVVYPEQKTRKFHHYYLYELRHQFVFA